MLSAPLPPGTLTNLTMEEQDWGFHRSCLLRVLFPGSDMSICGVSYHRLCSFYYSVAREDHCAFR